MSKFLLLSCCAPCSCAVIEKLAQEKDVSLNQLVIQCCQYALDHLDRGEDSPRE